MTTVWLKLEFSGKDAEEEAADLVSNVLDGGSFQEDLEWQAKVSGLSLSLDSITVEDPKGTL